MGTTYTLWPCLLLFLRAECTHSSVENQSTHSVKNDCAEENVMNHKDTS
jgi:hypothetical protein